MEPLVDDYAMDVLDKKADELRELRKTIACHIVQERLTGMIAKLEYAASRKMRRLF